MSRIRRQLQQVGHCGPTCVSMLLEEYGHPASPQAIAQAAGVTATIAAAGSRIDQLAAAVRILAPNFLIMGKFGSTIELLEDLTNQLDIAVGVEWQGRFHSDSGDFDIGHFSLITGVDRNSGYLDLVDPDPHSFYVTGRIAIDDFKKRWWEDNELEEGKKSRSFGLAFVIATVATEKSLVRWGLQPITFDFVRHASVDL
jgi:hypothetical protein